MLLSSFQAGVAGAFYLVLTLVLQVLLLSSFESGVAGARAEDGEEEGRRSHLPDAASHCGQGSKPRT